MLINHKILIYRGLAFILSRVVSSIYMLSEEKILKFNSKLLKDMILNLMNGWRLKLNSTMGELLDLQLLSIIDTSI
jgi:hypothetical protein